MLLIFCKSSLSFWFWWNRENRRYHKSIDQSFILFSKGQKKVVLFREIDRVKFFLSLTRPPSRMCIRIYIFSFKKQTNKQKTMQKKKKKLKKTREYPRKIYLRKSICGRPGEYFFVNRISGNKSMLGFFGLTVWGIGGYRKLCGIIKFRSRWFSVVWNWLQWSTNCRN